MNRAIKLEDFAPRRRYEIKINWPVLLGWTGCAALSLAFWFVLWSWSESSLRAALGVLP